MEVETKSKKRKHSKSISSPIAETKANFEEGALSNPNFTHRTVLVLSQKSEAEITTQNILLGGSTFPVNKDALGAIWDGVLTYSRILNDLSPQSSLSVFSVGNAVTRLNQWGPDNQLPDVIQRASQLKPVAKANILKGLECAVKALSEPLLNDEGLEDGEDDGKMNVNNKIIRSRIICVFQDQSNVVMEYSFTRYCPQQGGPSFDLIKSTQSFIDNTNEEMTNGFAKGKLIENCDIIFISVLSDHVKMVPAGKIYQISNTISVETHFITASNLQNAFIDLSVSHLRLGSLSISASNQMTIDNEKNSSNNIELLYSQHNNIQVFNPSPHFSTTFALGSNNWRSKTTQCYILEDSGQSCDSLATSSVHRIITLNANYRSTQFLQAMEEGRPMLLASGSENNSSMFIKLHGNGIFLHKLYDDNLHMDSIPNFFSPNYSKIRIEDYKIDEFNNIMNQSMFIFNDRQVARRSRTKMTTDSKINGESIPYVSTKKLIAATENFPILKTGTMLFNSSQTEELKSMLNQINILIRKPYLDKNAFNIIFSHLSKIGQEIKNNSYSLMYEKNQEKRKNLYKLLWTEIYKLAENVRNFSDKHLKLFTTLDSIYLIPKIDTNQQIMNIEVVEKEKDDPEKYRYTPRYKHNVSEVTTVVKTGNEEKEKHYAEKTHKETFTPSLLDPNKKCLQSIYWTKYNENHIESPYSGYPKL